MPARLGATYIGEDGNRHTPVMLHRAIFGSLERFIGILLENYAGALPLWLAPLQVVVTTITSDADSYAAEVVAELARAGLRAEADLRNEKINYKVREHSLAKIPVILAAGKREVAERTVALRRLGSQNQTSLTLAAAVEQLRAEAAVRGAHLTSGEILMRLLSFERNGRPGFGVVVGDGIVDAAERLAGKPRSLREALAAGALPALARLAAMKADFSLGDVTFAPVIPDAGRQAALRRHQLPAAHQGNGPRAAGAARCMFVRFRDSIVGHGQPLAKPHASEQLDFEGELAVVIGKRARRVAKERALDYVAGYACFNDGSVRDFQRHSRSSRPARTFTHSGAFGPWLVTADEIR